MIRDNDGNRISSKRKAKEIIRKKLMEIEFNWALGREDNDCEMTEFEIGKVKSSLFDLIDAIIKRHRFTKEDG